jgi:predicted nucleic acid-binding protein
LRQGIDPLRALAGTVASRDLVVCGVVRCEVARGLREPRVLKQFQNFWNVMIYVPTDNKLWESVEATLWKLDRQGITLPLTDVVIACCAQRVGASVLTLDHHFYDIPDVRVIDRLD